MEVDFKFFNMMVEWWEVIFVIVGKQVVADQLCCVCEVIVQKVLKYDSEMLLEEVISKGNDYLGDEVEVFELEV